MRAAIADPARTRGVRRLLHRDPETGDEPTLVDVPRRWVALDLDGVPLPDGHDPRGLAACGKHVLTLLPPEVRGARCIVQATASHGIKPGARLRIWFWLSRPVSTAELTQWFARSPVDAAAFRPAQPIYTAAPVFEDRADPIPQRLVMLPGARHEVPVPPPAMLRPVRRVVPLPRVSSENAALDYARRTIAAAPAKRHDTARRAGGFLIALAREGKVAAAAAAAAIRDGCLAAGLPPDEAEALARWTLTRAGGAA